MKTTLININDLLNNFETVGIAKRKIEEKWLKEHKIKESLDLTAFLQKLNLHESIFVFSENLVLPYKCIDVEDNKYIFYCLTDEALTKSISLLLDILNKLESNKLKLVSKTNLDLLQEGITQPKFPYFIFGQTIKEIKPIDS